MKAMITTLLALLLAVPLPSSPPQGGAGGGLGLGSGSITYIDANGDEQTLTSSQYTPLTQAGLTDLHGKLTSGWYVVSENISYGSQIQCNSGDLNLILGDGTTLEVGCATANAVQIGSGSLNIYGQSAQSGRLIATSSTGGATTYGINVYGGDLNLCGGQFNVSSLHANVVIPAGRAFSYNDGGSSTRYCTGTLTSDEKTAVAGKNLQLFNGLALDDAADNNTPITHYAARSAAVLLAHRTLYRDGSWNTLCLPFDVGDPDASTGHWFDGTTLEGATVMTLANSAGSGTGFDASTGHLSLYFVEANQIEAGHPYLIKWATTGAPIESPVFTGVTVGNEAPSDQQVIFPGGCFTGTYASATFSTTDKSVLFLGAGNTLYYPQPAGGNNPCIGACRAYFQLNPATNVRAFTLNFGDETDGISLTPNPSPVGEGNFKGEENDAWYDLSGRRIVNRKLPRGLYIHKGRKVVVP